MNSGTMLRSLLAAAVIVSGTALVVRSGTATAADTVDRTVLSDGFSAARGTDPDATRWTTYGNAGHDGDGHLLVAGQLRTAKPLEQAYGRAEARLRVRRESGAWRALGVLGTDGRVPAGEIETLADDRVGDDDFHTYVLDWTPAALVWSVDGRKVLRYTLAEAGKPFTLVLNLASGGRRSAVMSADSVTVTVRVTVAAPSTPPAAPWKAYTGYRAGQLVRYQGDTYRVRERHTSLPGWEPTRVPALFTEL